MNSMRVLITGANGLLGQKLTVTLEEREKVDVLAVSRGPSRLPYDINVPYKSLDLTDFEALYETFEDFKPTDVIHTAAMTNVDACELDPQACRQANVAVVRSLCGLCKEHNARLIHLSTDFIFDGAAGPYDERAVPNPLSVYGSAKYEAEQIIHDSGVRAAVARTILLYGVLPELTRTNIVLWVRDSLAEGKRIKVVNDQFRSPTLVEDLADGLCAILFRDKTGIYHLSGAEVYSILEIAHIVADCWKLDASLIDPVATAELGQPAPRPPKTGFIILKAQTELGYAPRSFKDGLTIVKRQLAYWTSNEIKI